MRRLSYLLLVLSLALALLLGALVLAATIVMNVYGL